MHRIISRRPILRENAILCLLPSCPKYLSTPSPKPERLGCGKITTLRSLYGTIGLECELQTYLKASTANFNNHRKECYITYG